MEISFIEDDNYYTLKISGEVDVTSSIKLDNALEKALNSTEKDVLVDCHELEYISSSGLGVFTSRVKSPDEPGQKVIIYGVSDKVMTTFTILGLHKVLPIFKTKDELNSEINGGQDKG